jgi:hypothetical protein
VSRRLAASRAADRGAGGHGPVRRPCRETPR